MNNPDERFESRTPPLSHALQRKPFHANDQWRAVAAAFAFNGVLFGAWASRVPTFKERFSLDSAELGLVLLALAAGAIIAFPLAGSLSNRLGPARVTWLTAVPHGPVLIVLALAPNGAMLAFILFFFGALHGAMDVAMNGWGAQVEDKLSRPVMSGFHALFSLGAGIGAGTGYLAARAGLEPFTHLLLAAIVLTLPTFALLLRAHAHTGHKPAGSTDPSVTEVAAERCPRPNRQRRLRLGMQTCLHRLSRLRPPLRPPLKPPLKPPFKPTLKLRLPLLSLPRGQLLLVGVIAFSIAIGEGAMADWSAVYLRQILASSEANAALGFTFFNLAMVVTRLCGDRIIGWLGTVMTVRLCGIIAAIGITVVISAGELSTALAGFTLIGVGYAIVIPQVFSRAARDPDVPAGTAIASVATLGYGGILLGPVVIGFVAHHTSLPTAFGMLAIFALSCVLLAGTMATPGRAEPLPEGQASGDQV